MVAAYSHETVLLHEAIQALNIRPEGCYVDGTFGRGGHSRLILDALGQEGCLLAIDKDETALEAAKQQFEADGRFMIAQGSFASLGDLVGQHGYVGKVDGLLLDLGVSSPQLDDPQRGFSFQQQGPLDMRMDKSQGVSAGEWLSGADEGEITEVLKVYGEERFSKRIARAIVEARQEGEINTTTQLAAIVSEAIPRHEKHKHPATRTFQALRIRINRELDDLKDVLQQSLDVLASGARLVVISFHSLEDRIVKQFMRKQSQGDRLPPGVPVQYEQSNARLKLIGKAQFASEVEVKNNPRARSAVMRVAEVL